MSCPKIVPYHHGNDTDLGGRFAKCPKYSTLASGTAAPEYIFDGVNTYNYTSSDASSAVGTARGLDLPVGVMDTYENWDNFVNCTGTVYGANVQDCKANQTVVNDIFNAADKAGTITDNFRYQYMGKKTAAGYDLANPGDTGDIQMGATPHMFYGLVEQCAKPVTGNCQGGGTNCPQLKQKGVENDSNNICQQWWKGASGDAAISANRDNIYDAVVSTYCSKCEKRKPTDADYKDYNGCEDACSCVNKPSPPDTCMAPGSAHYDEEFCKTYRVLKENLQDTAGVIPRAPCWYTPCMVNARDESTTPYLTNKDALTDNTNRGQCAGNITLCVDNSSFDLDENKVHNVTVDHNCGGAKKIKCVNGTPNDDGTACICPTGYSGKHCEVAPHPSGPSPPGPTPTPPAPSTACGKHGKLKADGKTCECIDNYTGAKCDIAPKTPKKHSWKPTIAELVGISAAGVAVLVFIIWLIIRLANGKSHHTSTPDALQSQPLSGPDV